MPDTKQRTIPCDHVFGQTVDSNGKPVGLEDGGLTTIASGKQITVSESHPRNRKTGKWLSGGPFYTSRVEYEISPIHVSDAYLASAGRFYTGDVYCKFPTKEERKAVGFQLTDEYGSKNESTMSADGATAISRCSPANPSSQLGVAIVEGYRDGLPALATASTWRDRTLRAKRAGDEYLNYQYGWVPLANDVSSGAAAAARSGQIMENYQSKEGYTTRRGYSFPSDISTATAKGIDGNGALFPNSSSSWWFGGENGRSIERVRSTKRWFSGAFAFPPTPDVFGSWGWTVNAGREARKLFGLELTPELFWEATPWSWAVDWFSNIGDVMSNISTFSGLSGQVMRYGYMMEETIDKITATQQFAKLRSYPNTGPTAERLRKAGPMSSSVTITTKRRVEANPFGFGVSWDGLSPFQISIAAALGISRFL
jgi:hypothetical protein